MWSRCAGSSSSPRNDVEWWPLNRPICPISLVDAAAAELRRGGDRGHQARRDRRCGSYDPRGRDLLCIEDEQDELSPRFAVATELAGRCCSSWGERALGRPNAARRSPGITAIYKCQLT